MKINWSQVLNFAIAGVIVAVVAPLIKQGLESNGVANFSDIDQ